MHVPEKGFALAEVLVAAGILAVGLLGLASLQVAAAGAAEGARARRVAVSLARNALMGGPIEPGTQSFNRDGREAGQGPFTVAITRLAPVGAAARWRVEVTWPGPRPGLVVLTRLALP
jgi:Tfp pilus assembly protein PilV